MYRCATWESTKSKLQHYRRREPEQSALYQLIYHLRDELPRVWEDRFQSTYGVLRDEALATFDEYLNCGLICHGAARVYCESCKHSLLVAFSCKKRGVCPSCMAKRAVKFAEHLHDEVLEPVPNRHVVFTIPKRLRAYFRYDRTLNGILFNAAWGSILDEIASDTATPAAVLTLQTAGEALNFHPHLHGCLANGLFSPDGSFKKFESIDQEKITACFGARVLAALHSRELISDEVVAQILSQEHTGFGVWLGEPFEDSDSERFVARYIERGPISLDRLSIQSNVVTYATNDGTVHKFDGLEFLALLTSHVTKPYESLTRYYGYYSCRARGGRKKLLRAIQPGQPAEPPAKASSSWAACMKRILEINPLECPNCKSAMRIVAFIQDTTEIKKIMRSLNLPDFKAPPPLPRGPPTGIELFQAEYDI